MSDSPTSRIQTLQAPYCYYAYAVSRDGLVDYMHYGYWKRETTTITEAQENLADLMKSYIPVGTKTILDSGCGLGRTTWDLSNSGFDVVGISPDRSLIDEARQKFPKIEKQFVCTRFEDYHPSVQFDLVFFQESSQYIDARVLFGHLGEITRPAGFVLICDEVRYTRKPRSFMRYAWDQQHAYLKLEKLDRGLKGIAARLVLHWLRLWDTRTANGVDVWLANSTNIARRIRKTYGRQAKVIRPPIRIEDFELCEKKDDYYFTCSRLVQYKRVDLIIDAFLARKHRQLIVAGDGPELPALVKQAGGAANIQFVGRQTDEGIRNYLSRARAFVFAANEDLGIVPIEAQACGTPVIALGRGGALETVRGRGAERPTGYFFDAQTSEAIVSALDDFEALSTPISPADCRENAASFRSEVFREDILRTVRAHWAELQDSGTSAEASGT